MFDFLDDVAAAALEGITEALTETEPEPTTVVEVHVITVTTKN